MSVASGLALQVPLLFIVLHLLCFGSRPQEGFPESVAAACDLMFRVFFCLLLCVALTSVGFHFAHASDDERDCCARPVLPQLLPPPPLRCDDAPGVAAGAT